MKKILASVLVAMAVLLCAMPKAWAEDFPDMQSFENWEVMPGLGDSLMVSYLGSDEQSMYMMLPANGKILILMAGPKMKPGSYNHLRGKTVPGQIRVDSRRTYDVSFRCVVEDKGSSLSVHLTEKFHDILLHEACRGSVLNVKVGGKKPILSLEYSLDGFTDALEYCLELLDS